MPTTETTLQLQFFDFLFGKNKGYACIAVGDPNGNKNFKHSFFSWPAQRTELSTYVASIRKKNAYFCVNLLSEPERKKQFALPTNHVWSDLDTCNPSEVDPPPHVIIESSPDRYQAIWMLSSDVPADEAESYSKRIAYRYVANGADNGCWDRVRLLRIPFTHNHKYGSAPEVKLLNVSDLEYYDAAIFEAIEVDQLKADLGEAVADMPDMFDLPSAENVIYEYRHKLKEGYFKELYAVEPDADDDWSKILWRLINILVEADMTREEVFVVAAASKCNKYDRDKRPIKYLWREVLKAWNAKQAFAIIAGDLDNKLEFPGLITDKELDQSKDTFLDQYVEWGIAATDACAEYHELAGAIMLSATLADGLHVKTSFGKIVPNLWGLILGESTLTRKTTAMRMAMDLITELDSEVLLATSGSVEGILTGLSDRPSKTSIFYRDEVSGFFDEIQKKDYLSGMAEALAHLYDCPAIDHRRLRKETITIVSPVFIFFGGGIRDRVYESVREDLFYSGFLPRFLIVSGEANLDNVRPIGPPSTDSKQVDLREQLRTTLADLHEIYAQQVQIKIAGQTTNLAKNIEAVLTPAAWERVGAIETLLTRTANESASSLIALPTFVRISTSLLKLATLISATRQEPTADYKITVEERDIISAAKFVQKWGKNSAHMIGNTGKTFTERTLDKILRCVRDYPGITRSDVMRRHHLTSQEANMLFTTLDDRGVITLKKEGRGSRVYPI